MNYIIRTTKMTVLPEGESIFSEHATHIEIVDEAVGEFLKISQHDDDSIYKDSILINKNEWGSIKNAIDDMLDEIERHEEK